METLVLIAAIARLLGVLVNDKMSADNEGRGPTPEEKARQRAAQRFVEGEWNLLAPPPNHGQ